jgi:hypothetical protein
MKTVSRGEGVGVVFIGRKSCGKGKEWRVGIDAFYPSKRENGGEGVRFTALSGGRGGEPSGAGVTRGGGGLARATRDLAAASASRQWRARVGWRGTWEQGWRSPKE